MPAQWLQHLVSLITARVPWFRLLPLIITPWVSHNERVALRATKAAAVEARANSDSVSSLVGKISDTPAFNGNVADTVKLSGGGGVGVVGDSGKFVFVTVKCRVFR